MLLIMHLWRMKGWLCGIATVYPQAVSIKCIHEFGINKMTIRKFEGIVILLFTAVLCNRKWDAQARCRHS